MSSEEYLEGLSAEELFERGVGITFDDFIFYPGIVDFPFHEIGLETYLTRNIKIKRGLTSSAMDTVTEAKTAIALAREGGVGVIHCNNTVDEEESIVREVKRTESGLITNPKVLGKNDPVSKLKEIREKYGFSSVPITEDGTLDSRVVGLATKRHTRWKDETTPLGQIMHQAGDNLENLTTAPEGTNQEKAQDIMIGENRKRLLIVDDQYRLKALATFRDIDQRMQYPLASLNNEDKLLVCAAVSTGEKERTDRVDALVAAGADVICIDSSQAAKTYTLELAEYIKGKHDVDLIIGNVVTIRQVKWLYDRLGDMIDAIKVGMGSGRICTTQDTAGVGGAQLAAVFRISNWLKINEIDIPIIADGGIDGSGDIIKAYGSGASTIMAGGLFAGTREAPGEYHYVDGVLVKTYRGMGSIDAQRKRGTFRYLSEAQKTSTSQQKEIIVSQGVSGVVPDKGSIHDFVAYLDKAIRIGFEDLGIKNMEQLHEDRYSGKLRFERRTLSSLREASVHHLLNYKKETMGGK